MPVIGYAIKSITAERKKEATGQVNINSTQNILNVDSKEINIFGKQSPLVIQFEFTTAYEPSVGSIKLNGEVFYATDDDKKVVKDWKKEKKLPENIDLEVKNFLFKKCLSLGLDISEEMQLPAPLIFPMVVPKKEEQKAEYIG
jgi:hypothetical protein